MDTVLDGPVQQCGGCVATGGLRDVLDSAVARVGGRLDDAAPWKHDFPSGHTGVLSLRVSRDDDGYHVALLDGDRVRRDVTINDETFEVTACRPDVNMPLICSTVWSAAATDHYAAWLASRLSEPA